MFHHIVDEIHRLYYTWGIGGFEQIWLKMTRVNRKRVAIP